MIHHHIWGLKTMNDPSSYVGVKMMMDTRKLIKGHEFQCAPPVTILVNYTVPTSKIYYLVICPRLQWNVYNSLGSLSHMRYSIYYLYPPLHTWSLTVALMPSKHDIDLYTAFRDWRIQALILSAVKSWIVTIVACSGCLIVHLFSWCWQSFQLLENDSLYKP